MKCCNQGVKKGERIAPSVTLSLSYAKIFIFRCAFREGFLKWNWDCVCPCLTTSWTVLLLAVCLHLMLIRLCAVHTVHYRDVKSTVEMAFNCLSLSLSILWAPTQKVLSTTLVHEWVSVCCVSGFPAIETLHLLHHHHPTSICPCLLLLPSFSSSFLPLLERVDMS